MPGQTMKRGGRKLITVPRSSFPAGLMNQDHFCFSCEQIFANRKYLEEHTCTFVSFICSCGTEFTEYNNMLEHSTTHEPGYQVLNHETIKKRRIEKHKEEVEKLKRLHEGEVIWEVPSVPSASRPQVPKTSAHMPQGKMQFPQVPDMRPSMPQASLLPNSAPQTDAQNVFAGVGAPTVDLWTLYQPVVLLNMDRKFNKKKPYSCGKCGQCFMSKASLVSHHSSHVTDKVSGCIGCGMLLSSKKMVPRFHVCNSPTNTTKFRLITARPPNYKPPSEAVPSMRQNLSAHLPQTASLQIINSSVNSKASQMSLFSSTLQRNNQSIKTYNNNNSGLNVIPALLFKNQNLNASRPCIIPRKNLYPAMSNRRGLGRGFPRPVQIRLPINSASNLLSRSSPTSSTSSGFTCRVCHIAFETPQLLQRHKCVKAQEFMAQHVRVGKQHYKPNRMTPMGSASLAQMNGERRLVIPPTGSIKNQVGPVGLDREQGALAVNGKIQVDSDDDCYIVESGTDKPAEMIYQVTSSVPIKT